MVASLRSSSSRQKLGLYGLLQMLEAERYVADNAIHKERRSRSDTAPGSAFDVLQDTLQIDVITHLVVVSLEVEPRLFGILSEALCLQMQLILEQQIMHRPELSLRTSGFGRLRGKFRVRVHLSKRKMPEYEAHTLAEMLAQDLHRGVSLTAVGTFEVSILDERYPGCLRTMDVIEVCHGDRKHRRFRGFIHWPTIVS